MISGGTPIGPIVAPLNLLRCLLGVAVETEHRKPVFAGNVKLEVTGALTVTKTAGVLDIERQTVTEFGTVQLDVVTTEKFVIQET